MSTTTLIRRRPCLCKSVRQGCEMVGLLELRSCILTSGWVDTAGTFGAGLGDERAQEPGPDARPRRGVAGARLRARHGVRAPRVTQHLIHLPTDAPCAVASNSRQSTSFVSLPRLPS